MEVQTVIHARERGGEEKKKKDMRPFNLTLVTKLLPKSAYQAEFYHHYRGLSNCDLFPVNSA